MNAVILALFYAVIMTLHFIPLLWGFMDPIVNFFLAPVYILMLRQIPKPLVMTIHGAVIGLFHTMTGWWPGLVAGLLAGLAADGIAASFGGYAKGRGIWFGVPVFATVKTFVFYSPVYLLTLFPVFEDVVSTWPKEAVEDYTAPFAMLVLALNLVACLAGLGIGHRMIGRHFSRVGMVSR
jgi:putative ECF transporter S component (TIGR02185 family)